MKKVVSFLLISMIMLIGFFATDLMVKHADACGTELYSFENRKQAVNIKTVVTKSKDKDISIDLAIPVIEGMKDRWIQNSINAMIRKRVMGFRNSTKFQAKKDRMKMHPYDAVSSFFITLNKNNILSLTLELYAYTGGAHGMTYRIPYNLDLNTGNQLALKDLFKEGVNYKDIINQEISRKIEESEPGLFFEGAFKGISDNQPFYIKDGAIVAYFPLYEIAPYAAGFPEFDIPFSLFDSGVKISS